MKYVFIGDVHGKVNAVEAALSKDGHKVFVGDFCDSFDRSVDDHEKCLVLVLDAIESDEATAIFGNHELSYLMPYPHRCSGYSTSMEQMLRPHQKRIRDSFVPFLEIGYDWLVTHAGLHPDVAIALPETWESEFQNPNSPMHWIGRSRGGRHPIGGMFWCDFNDEFQPIDGMNQVFGHTRHRTRDIRTKTGNNSINYCIDCLDTKIKFLELEV